MCVYTEIYDSISEPILKSSIYMDLAMTRKLRKIILEYTIQESYTKSRPPYLSKKLHSHSEPEGWAKGTEGSPELRSLNLQTKTPIVKGLYSTQLFPFIVSVTFEMSNLSYLIVLLDKIQKVLNINKLHTKNYFENLYFYIN